MVFFILFVLQSSCAYPPLEGAGGGLLAIIFLVKLCSTPFSSPTFKIPTVKNSLAYFKKAFENWIRPQIISVLVANVSYDFNSFKELLELTDGNLASHLKVLEKEAYTLINKSFVGGKPNTRGAFVFLVQFCFPLLFPSLRSR